MSSKQVMTDAAAYARRVRDEYMMHFLALLHNAVYIENLPADIEKRYFLHVLFSRGQIGYGNGYYLPIEGYGIDLYGLPEQYAFIAPGKGKIFTKKANDCVILRINDQHYPIIPFIRMKSEQIAEIETSIHQNLFAVRTQAVYECADQASLLSMQNAFKARRLGAEVVFQTSSFTNDNKLTVHPTGADYICDKLNELKKEYINDVYERMGIMRGSDKTERVQAAEINANIDIAYENIYTMIDTFNHDAERGGLNIRLRPNGCIDTYMNAFTSGTEQTDTDEEF